MTIVYVILCMGSTFWGYREPRYVSNENINVVMRFKFFHVMWSACEGLGLGEGHYINLHNWLIEWLEGQDLEYDSKFGLRGMSGGSYELMKDVFKDCWTTSSAFLMDGTVAEGGKLGHPGSATDQQSISDQFQGWTLSEALACLLWD